jgi:16S rRNA (adenine1518-N6/adenine1519-N6)-dimethyltransferase
MTLFSKKIVKELLKKYRIRPSKKFGQNFLINKRVIKNFLEVANLQKKSVVLEIGPGTGNLTQGLARGAKRVIAVEKDPKMIKVLKETTKNLKNIQIIKEDILKIPDSKLKILNSYKVVGSLPFYLAAPIIRRFLESKKQPEEMLFMVQKEVAQRICAKPPRMNLLAVSVQFYAKPKIIFYVPKESFWPRPKVDSAILRITPLINAEKKLIDANFFFKIVKAGFSQPRKQILNNLSKELKLDKPHSREISLQAKEKIKKWLLKNEVRPNQRAETLSIKDWIKLTKTLNAKYGL